MQGFGTADGFFVGLGGRGVLGRGVGLGEGVTFPLVGDMVGLGVVVGVVTDGVGSVRSWRDPEHRDILAVRKTSQRLKAGD